MYTILCQHIDTSLVSRATVRKQLENEYGLSLDDQPINLGDLRLTPPTDEETKFATDEARQQFLRASLKDLGRMMAM